MKSVAAAFLIPLGLLAHAQGALVGRVLLAAVTDARNRPVVDLDADDFVVHEDDEPREVLAVRIADYPLVLVLDNASHTAADFEAIRAAAVRFVRRVGDRSVAVVTMGDPTESVAGFEADRETVVAAIEKLTAVESPRRPLQAVAEAARLVAGAGSPFAALVVASVAAPVVEPEPRGLLAEFIESRDILHVVTRTRAPTPGAPATAGADDLLRDIAMRSGGRAAAIYSPVSFQIALDQVADTLATEMIVEYLAPPESPETADVRVGVAIPGTRVRGLGVWR